MSSSLRTKDNLLIHSPLNEAFIGQRSRLEFRQEVFQWVQGPCNYILYIHKASLRLKGVREETVTTQMRREKRYHNDK